MKISAACDIRLTVLPLAEGGSRSVVIVAPPPLRAELSLFRRRGHCSAMLTHDAGLTWPDRRGEQMAEAALAEGLPVALAFATLADALACHRRVLREVVQ